MLAELHILAIGGIVKKLWSGSQEEKTADTAAFENMRPDHPRAAGGGGGPVRDLGAWNQIPGVVSHTETGCARLHQFGFDPHEDGGVEDDLDPTGAGRAPRSPPFAVRSPIGSERGVHGNQPAARTPQSRSRP